MKLKLKLTVINAGLVIVFLAVLGSVILYRSSALQREAAIENLMALAESTAKTVKDRNQRYLNAAKSVAQIMNSYKNVDVPLRRVFCDQVMRGILDENFGFTGIYTVWKPNVLDNMDEVYAGTAGTDQSGRFMSHWTRELGRGRLDRIPYADPEGALRNATLDDFVSNPVKRAIHGKETFVITMQVPIVDEASQVLGVIGIDIDIGELQSVVEVITPYTTGRAALVANDGTVAGYFSAPERGKNMTAVLAPWGAESVAATREAIETGKPVMITAHNKETGHEEIAVSFPFYMGTAKTAWTILVFAPLSEVLRPINALIRFAVAFAAFSGLAAALVIFAVSGAISGHIVRIGDMMRDISEGEGDLVKRLAAQGNDEIGHMGGYFNRTLDKIRDMVVAIKGESGSLSEIGVRLASNMTETAAAITEITATIESIKKQAGLQAEGVTQTDTVLRQVSGQIEELNGQIEEQGAVIARSAQAIERMLSGIDEMLTTIVKNEKNVEKLTQASDMGRNGIQEVSQSITEIARESEGLLDITLVLENIAGQTNLLSMNAAIEAAHAGESGKGFAVVADEIRKLAESSSEQSKTIASVLHKIKAMIDSIARSNTQVMERFEVIDMNIKSRLWRSRSRKSARPCLNRSLKAAG